MQGHVAFAGSWQAPLDTQTQHYLSKIATAQVQQQDATILKRAPATLRSSLLPPQVLLVERVESKHSQSSHAEVFVYSYDSEQTTRHLLDAITGTVYQSAVVPDVSLPLNAFESEYVLTLLKNDQAITAKLIHDHQTQLGSDFTGWDSIESRVSIWLPGNTSSDASQACLVQRCALVTLFNGGRYNFSVEPVINLNTGDIYLDAIQ